MSKVSLTDPNLGSKRCMIYTLELVTELSRRGIKRVNSLFLLIIDEHSYVTKLTMGNRFLVVS